MESVKYVTARHCECYIQEFYAKILKKSQSLKEQSSDWNDTCHINWNL